MITTNSYYEIGAGHTYCQDYAGSGSFEFKGTTYHYAIVSDGCSGSEDSDIGARWYVKRFPFAVRNALMGVGPIAEGIKLFFVNEIESAAAQMNVKTTAFDATVVALLYDKNADILHSFIWGDGKVFHKLKDGDTGTLTDMSFVSNAPYYLSYLTSFEREALYSKTFGNMYADSLSYIVSKDNVVRIAELDKSFQKSHYEFFPNASKVLDFSSVFSDGIDTYHRKDDVDILMQKNNVFNQLTQYKNRQGDFVERRMQMVKKVLPERRLAAL